MPLPIARLARTTLGSERLGAVRLERGRVRAQLERVYAQKVIAEREAVPVGALAREAVCVLLLRGSLFKDAIAESGRRLTRLAMAAELARKRHPLGVASAEPVPALEAWVAQRVEALGLESGDDLPLLSASDFTAPDLPYEIRSAFDEQFPMQVSVGDASYRAEYDLKQNQVILHMVKGSRNEPPPLNYLPHFTGLRICVSSPRGMRVLRA
jgi:hypothetical protein